MRSVRCDQFKRWALLSAILASGGATADNVNEHAAIIDPPGRVARLSFVQGTVSLSPADAEGWIDAPINRPLTSGDRIWVDAGARAEVQVDTATIQLDQSTDFSFTTLGDATMEISLSDGAIVVHAHALEANERIEVDTPNATVMIRQPGHYVVEATADGERTSLNTLVTVRSGTADVTGADQRGYLLNNGEQGDFGGQYQLSSIVTQAERPSAFETWANERDALATQSVAARYVAPGVVGYEDLDRNGTWAYEPDYGNVWQPTTLAVDWAPYRYGRWVWISPWGWTWIDDAPWGYAPFHYGRWAYLRQRWCWVPGTIHARPLYAPALVAWVGSPSFGVNFRPVGWLPLGPNEIYIPGRRTSWHYFSRVNAAHAARDRRELENAYHGRRPHHRYRNRTAPHAVTTLEHDALVAGHGTRSSPHAAPPRAPQQNRRTTRPSPTQISFADSTSRRSDIGAAARAAAQQGRPNVSRRWSGSSVADRTHPTAPRSSTASGPRVSEPQTPNESRRPEATPRADVAPRAQTRISRVPITAPARIRDIRTRQTSAPSSRTTVLGPALVPRVAFQQPRMRRDQPQQPSRPTTAPARVEPVARPAQQRPVAVAALRPNNRSMAPAASTVPRARGPATQRIATPREAAASVARGARSLNRLPAARLPNVHDNRR